MNKFLLTAAAVLFCLVNLWAQETGKKDDNALPNEPLIEAIPVTEIANKANEVQLHLEKVGKQTDDRTEIAALEENIHVLLDSIDGLNPEQQTQELAELNERQVLTLKQNWNILHEDCNDFQKTLNTFSAKLSAEETTLGTLLETWQLTAKTVYVSEVPIPIRKRVQSVVSSIESTLKKVNAHHKNLLLLQEEISVRELKISRLLAAIDDLDSQSQQNLLAKDALPLWEAFSAPKDTANRVSFKELVEDVVSANTIFISNNKQRFMLHLVIFLLIIGYFYHLRYRVKHKKLVIKSAAQTKRMLNFLQKPMVSGIILGIFFSIWLYPLQSIDFRQFVVLISIIPTVLLVPLYVNKSFSRIIYLIAVLAFINFGQIVFSAETLLQRLNLLFTSILALSVSVLIFIEQRKATSRDWTSLGRIIVKINPLIFLLLLAAIVFNIAGIVELSKNLYVGVVKGLYFGALFSLIDNILTGLSGILFRKQRKSAFLHIAEYAPKIEKTIETIIHALIVYYWFKATTVSFGVFALIEKGWDALMDLSWQVGNTTLELSTLITFVLILVISGILARTLRIILDLEVFTRVKLPRGVPGTISMVTRYTIIGFGIFLAISTVTDLSKLGIMTGAIGVGLGFGLQNVIANFVSGIIISFERPMQVGDLVEINNIMGNVEEIGVRSSTIKTFDGSEVLVPNNDFISNQFTNWTLTDPKRRIKLNVKVALDANPHQVIVMLQKIVDEHPGVHTHPEPVVTFDGYGDYYLEFTMYYWISENILQYKSEIALQVYDQILAANLQIPNPRQDVNVNLKGSDSF